MIRFRRERCWKRTQTVCSISHQWLVFIEDSSVSLRLDSRKLCARLPLAHHVDRRRVPLAQAPVLLYDLSFSLHAAAKLGLLVEQPIHEGACRNANKGRQGERLGRENGQKPATDWFQKFAEVYKFHVPFGELSAIFISVSPLRKQATRSVRSAL